MKRLTILMIAMLMGIASLWARPGYSKPIDVFQPDGTTVTLLMRGDEYLSYMTTIDGYTVIKGEDGYYRYAEKADGQLAATGIIAKNPAERSEADNAFLKGRKKNICSDITADALKYKATAAQMIVEKPTGMDNGSRRSASIWDRINYDNFKGLVVLVEWNDRKFTTDDPLALYQRLTNERNLHDTSHTYYPVDVPGSARDYFYDNSMGIFNPTFDVVGPFTINYSCTYPKPKNETGQQDNGYGNRLINIIKAIMTQLNNTTDFSDYDLNNDGVIDMIYFIFAGYGSYVQGNDYRYIWPHANDFTDYSYYYNLRYDGKRFGRYACSVEIQDYEGLASQHVWLDGIGTICHEFSHVLGLADHYDTNYEENGQANHPGEWDIMAGGADFNYGLSPVGYNAFERYVLGFTEPEVLSVAGNYELPAFNTGNKAYRVLTNKTDEEFFIENRQKQGWDTFLPKAGLLLWRADTSNPNIWKQNLVNVNPAAMYFEIIDHAPFTELDLTASTCQQWGEKGASIDLFDIREQDGLITFEAGKDLYAPIVEDFESTPATSTDAQGLSGKFCSWDLVNATIESTTSAYGTGMQLAKIMRSGSITTSVLQKGLRTLKFTVQNGNQKTRFSIKIQKEGEDNWTDLTTTVTLAKSAEQTFTFIDIPKGSRLKFSMAATTASATCYLDNIEVTIPRENTGIRAISKDAVTDHTVYNLAGQRVGNGYRGLVISNGRKLIRK